MLPAQTTNPREGLVPFPLIGTSDAARFLGRTVKWLQRNVESLAIPHYRINGRLRFRVFELETWVQNQAAQ